MSLLNSFVIVGLKLTHDTLTKTRFRRKFTMMKVICVCAVLFVLLCDATRDRRSLFNSLQKVVYALPVKEYKLITGKHLSDDGGFIAVIDYLQSSKWKNLTDDLLRTEEFKNVTTFLKDMGLPIRIITSLYNRIYKLKPGDVSNHAQGNLKSFADEIAAITPVNKILGIIEEQWETCPEFKEMSEKLTNEKFIALISTLTSTTEAQKIIDTFHEFGVDINEYLSLMQTYLDWN